MWHCSTNVPYELIGTLSWTCVHLKTSFVYPDLFTRVSPGYIINDSVCAIPETQDFWVTFYRKDILRLPWHSGPDTWNEVIEILPELQRYG